MSTEEIEDKLMREVKPFKATKLNKTVYRI
jgi:hypothetical protein